MAKTLTTLVFILFFLSTAFFPVKAEGPINIRSFASAEDLKDFGGEDELKEFLSDDVKELHEFRQEMAQDVTQFIEEADRDFIEFLKEAWEEFDFEEPSRALEKPKPVKLPVFEPSPDKETAPAEPVKAVITTPDIPVEKPQVAEKPQPPESVVTPPTPEPLPEQPVAKKPTPPEPVIIAQPAPVVLPPAVPIPVVKPVTPPPIVTQKPVVPLVPPKPDLGESRIVEKPKEPAPPAVPPPPAAEEVSGTPLAFSFFGSNISMHYDEKMNISMGQPVDNQKISAYWKSMAQTDYKKLINQSLQYKDQLQLNDWGYFLFLNMTAENILNDSSDNDRNLLVWFMLTKSGYEAKIGFRDDLVTILLPASSKLFGRFYFTMEGKKFYAVAPSEKEQDLKKIFTYKASYPGSDKSMDFMVRSYPLLAGETSTKKLSFNYDGKEHVIAVQINQNNIPYFEYYPQTEVQIYADAPFPKWMENSMLTALLPLIKGKSEVDAVNLLLRFSQTAFEYKTDQDQFNREKFLFPEETVFYPYSDCEDRSIMFSYLVRNLLGLEVILLHYPNHIATAVLLKGQPVGDQVIVNDKHFTICDPTYINASIGKAMPQFRGVVPEVFTL